VKLTRRQLVVAAAVSNAVAATAFAQTSASASANSEFAKAAREGVQRNGETLAKFAVPVSVEPAFQFKA